MLLSPSHTSLTMFCRYCIILYPHLCLLCFLLRCSSPVDCKEILLTIIYLVLSIQQVSLCLSIIYKCFQLWSLKLGAAMLTSHKSSLAWVLGTSQPLVPALLSSLAHHSPHIRRAVFECVSKLTTIVGGRLTQSNHSVLLESILAHKEEILTDAR